MSLRAYWAYDFFCDEPIEALLALMNTIGPWTWTLRDSYWYGEYLNTRPVAGVRVRIHEGEDSRYSALLQIEQESEAEQAAIDAILRALLDRVKARDVAETEPYD